MIQLLTSRKFLYLALIVLICSSYSIISNSFENNGSQVIKDTNRGIAEDSTASQKAFLAVYDVLMSPRCMNCHPSGDVPLQGDDSHLHTMGIKRGEDGNGVHAMKCANCHQPQNTPGLNMPPGNPKWHLPPSNMRMVFQGKTPRQLAAQLKDPGANGGKTMQQLIDHVTSDELVLGGWNPGDGRTLPPLSHDEFAKKFREWVEKGAYLPVE